MRRLEVILGELSQMIQGQYDRLNESPADSVEASVCIAKLEAFKAVKDLLLNGPVTRPEDGAQHEA